MTAKRWAIGGAIVLAIFLLGCGNDIPKTSQPASSPQDSDCNNDCWQIEHVVVQGRQVTCVIYLAKAIDCDWANQARIDQH